MKDFFGVMGKAFAVVFGSASALALVLVLLVLAIRPLLKSQLRAQPADDKADIRPLPGSRVPDWDLPNHLRPKHEVQPDFIPVPPEAGRPIVSVRDCAKSGCTIYDPQSHFVGFLPRAEITKAQWIPAEEHRK